MPTVVANGIAHHVQRLPAKGQTGDGPAPIVVLVHGMLIDSLASYYITLGPAFAAAGLDVIMYDLRGHGRSTRPGTGYRLADFLDDLDALLDVLEVRTPVHLVGNSFGGTIAFGYAERRPERVASIAAIESEPATTEWAAKIAASLRYAKTELNQPGVGPWLKENHTAYVARMLTGMGRLLASCSLAEELPMSELLPDVRIAAVTAPTMTVYGAESDLAGQANWLGSLLPSCTTVVIPEQGHMVLVDRPAMTRELILDWLRGQSGDQGGSRPIVRLV